MLARTVLRRASRSDHTEGTLRQAGRRGFQILVGYIFGRNRGARGQPPGAQLPVKLAMTAPVTLRQSGDGYLFRFFLPKATSLASAPEPMDPAVQVQGIDGGRFAVIRYSGRWSTANDDRHLARLQQGMAEAGLRWVGAPIIARHNPPALPTLAIKTTSPSQAKQVRPTQPGCAAQTSTMFY